MSPRRTSLSVQPVVADPIPITKDRVSSARTRISATRRRWMSVITPRRYAARGPPGNPRLNLSVGKQSATTAPPAESHTSKALGYRIEVPPGWLLNEGYLEWEKASETLCGSPGVDTFRSPEGDPCLLVAR